MTDAKPQPESRAARLLKQCLCGCGEITKPESNFRSGHDMRVKRNAIPSRERETGGEFRLPDVTDGCGRR